MQERAIPPLVQEAWAGRRTEILEQQAALSEAPPVAAIVFDAYGTLLDVPGALARLGDWPLAILSNGSPPMLEPLLAKSGLAGAFRLVLSVDPVGAYKPDPRVYALAPAALGVEAAAILFVSANAWDAIGAKSCGFQVAWCNRAGAPLDTHGPAPDLE